MRIGREMKLYIFPVVINRGVLVDVDSLVCRLGVDFRPKHKYPDFLRIFREFWDI